MPTTLFLTLGSAIAIIWGIAHIIPTKAIVAGFGSLSPDNHRILTMEWVAEGLALVFVGGLPLLLVTLAPSSDPVAAIVYRASGVMLLVMAAWTALTGSRTSIWPIRLCPVVKTAAATLMFLGSQ